MHTSIALRRRRIRRFFVVFRRFLLDNACGAAAAANEESRLYVPDPQIQVAANLVQLVIDSDELC